jgi:hypothetical protein
MIFTKKNVFLQKTVTVFVLIAFFLLHVSRKEMRSRQLLPHLLFNGKIPDLKARACHLKNWMK